MNKNLTKAERDACKFRPEAFDCSSGALTRTPRMYRILDQQRWREDHEKALGDSFKYYDALKGIHSDDEKWVAWAAKQRDNRYNDWVEHHPYPKDPLTMRLGDLLGITWMRRK
jgi:hypothetical protein